MNDPLSPQARSVLEEETKLLERVKASLREAYADRKKGPSSAATVGLLRELRDEAAEARAEDLPQMLHELSLRQRLAERPAEAPLPELDAPYLAHLRVNEGGKTRDYLLGHATHVDPRAEVRIVDWRVAPIAQIFYRYREGDAYEEELPGRLAEGVVEARRIVVIERGELAQIVTDGLLLVRQPDGSWASEDRSTMALRPGGAGTAARSGVLGVGVGAKGRPPSADITALLDAEQYAAISAPASTPLLVLGAAGSGKTTVALHRLARLAAADPERHPLARMQVVVPEEGLARLSRRLLEPLGARAAQVRTLDAWATDLARQVFEQRLSVSDETPGLVVSLKRHPAFFKALRSRVSGLRPESATFPRLRRRLADALTDRGFLTRVVEASGGDLPKSAVEESVRHTMLQIADSVDKQLRSITDASMKQSIDGRRIEEGTPEELAGTVDLEDLPVLLFMRSLAVKLGGESIAHLVLDEAEDFSLFELSVLGKLLGATRGVTLAGDEAQQTASSFAGWREALGALSVGDASVCRLSVSYRCPRPVAELARRLLGAMAPEGPAKAAREGAPVGYFRFPAAAPAQLFLVGALADLVAREPRASVGVIAHDEASARAIHALLADVPEARLVLRGEFTFEPGIDVTDIDNAKGLEWDYVIVPDATLSAYPDDSEARRRLHVAVTRASHQLWLVSGGIASPLLEAIGPEAP